MRLKNEGLEIETGKVRSIFPASFIIVDWECEAVDLYDDIESVPYYEFHDIVARCYYYNSDNELKEFKPIEAQSAWIIPFIETDAANELEKRK